MIDAADWDFFGFECQLSICIAEVGTLVEGVVAVGKDKGVFLGLFVQFYHFPCFLCNKIKTDFNKVKTL